MHNDELAFDTGLRSYMPDESGVLGPPARTLNGLPKAAGDGQPLETPYGGGGGSEAFGL